LHQSADSGAGLDRRFELPEPAPKTPSADMLNLIVVGAHLSGMALNHELLALGGTLVQTAATAPGYRLFVLPGVTPQKPGLVRDHRFDGAGIAVEIWALPAEAFGRFVEAIPSPLGIGKIMLADGSAVSGFLAEPDALLGAEEITALGGWRAYVAAQAQREPLTAGVL